MADGAIAIIGRRLGEAVAGGASAAWWTDALGRVADEGPRALPELLPGLARRLGRGLLGGGVVHEPAVTTHGRAARVDLDTWRVCDAAGLELMRACDADPVALFQGGDYEERTIVLRAQALLPAGPATARLFGEIQRTNTATHFEALACDHNLPSRACGIAGFGPDELNRLVLKAAFLDLPLARLLGIEEHANAELSRMLQDLATEREAAGRPVWADTDRLVGLAPAPGTLLRLLGALTHGDERRRRAAAEALRRVPRPDVAHLIAERAAHERADDVRRLLDGLAAEWGS